MIREKLTSEKVHIRILYLSILYMIAFFGLTVLSYFILPEGILLNQNNFKNFETSSHLIFSTLQIFLFNMISVALVIIGSCFAKKKEKHQNYMSLGYLCFMVCISINAITLGTWSFGIQTESVPLIVRIIGIFNITKCRFNRNVRSAVDYLFVCQQIFSYDL